MLDQLPQEILNSIVRELSLRRDVHALCLVSRVLHKAVIPLLYEEFVFLIGEGPNDYLTISPPYWPFQTKLHLIKDVHFVSAFYSSLQSRCPHNFNLVVTGDGYSPDVDLISLHALEARDPQLVPHGFDILEARLESLFEQLGRSGLRKFSWDVGICLPQQLHNSPWIMQNQLRYLSLIKDGTCSSITSMTALQRPKYLQTFSWQGLTNIDDLVQVGMCLKNNAKHLHTLRLNLIAWDTLIDSWVRAMWAKHSVSSERLGTVPNMFAKSNLSVRSGVHKTFFPRLTRLSLSCISFSGVAAELVYAFNFSSLRDLSLWNCPGTADLLTELAKDQHKINLKSLELTITDSKINGPYTHQIQNVGDFLGSFHGLKNVFLLLPDESDWRHWSQVWDPISAGLESHAGSLERLVCHERSDLDLGDKQIYWDSKINDVLRSPRLRCFGTSCDVRGGAKRLLQTMHPKPTFEVLHLRASRDTDERVPDDIAIEEYLEWDYCTSLLDVWNSMYPWPQARADRESDIVPLDLLDLAQMAFAPNGLPNLRLIAWGDFSHCERYGEYTLLLCKNEGSTVLAEEIDDETFHAYLPKDLTFRQVTEQDTTLLELFRKEHDMLSACSMENIFIPQEDGLYS